MNTTTYIYSDDAASREDKRMAGILAAIYAIAVIAILILVIFREPFPPPAEEGLIINFGTTATGSGNEIPQETEEVINSPETPTTSSPSQVEDVVTQENTETVVVPDKPTTTPSNNTPTENPVEETPSVNEGAIFGGVQNSGNSSSQGEAGGQGDQGDPSGSNNSNNYDGSTTGLGNSGIGVDLSGRSAVSTPTPAYNCNEQGKVKIKIKVDRNGNVSSAEYTALGSTTSASCLVDQALKAARQAKFNQDSTAPEVQQGYITYTFKLN